MREQSTRFRFRREGGTPRWSLPICLQKSEQSSELVERPGNVDPMVVPYSRFAGAEGRCLVHVEAPHRRTIQVALIVQDDGRIRAHLEASNFDHSVPVDFIGCEVPLEARVDPTNVPGNVRPLPRREKRGRLGMQFSSRRVDEPDPLKWHLWRSVLFETLGPTFRGFFLIWVRPFEVPAVHWAGGPHAPIHEVQKQTWDGQHWVIARRATWLTRRTGELGYSATYEPIGRKNSS